MSAVEACLLSVGYQRDCVVDELTFVVEPGGLHVLMGTNGSGKSTLLRTIAGLLPIVDGGLTVFGDRPGSAPARVGYLAQRPATTAGLPLRAADVVRMGRFARHGLVRPLGRADRHACAAAMEWLGVTEFADAPLSELSGGQQQRTFLAQLLARQADLLLVDEPTAGLDQPGRATVAEVLAAERARGAAVIMATHDLADADHADRAMLLARRVVAAGSPAEVLTDENLRSCFGFTGRH